MRFGMVLAMSVLAFGCSKQERGAGGLPPRLPVEPLAVAATLASVTLADDCAHAEAPAAGARPIAADVAAGSCGPGGCGPSFRAVCQQTTMQLTLSTGQTGVPANIKVVSVELIEQGGGTLGMLQPRDPRMWTEAAGTYQVWDETLSPRQSLQVMYNLSAPDWSRIGGKWEAQGKSFRLRVTLSVAGAESTIEKEVESPTIMIEPPVVT